MLVLLQLNIQCDMLKEFVYKVTQELKVKKRNEEDLVQSIRNALLTNQATDVITALFSLNIPFHNAHCS